MERLLEQFYTGEKEGISTFIERYAPRLVAFLCGYVPKADAEDLVEETFLVLLEKKRSFPNEKALLAFLYRTAKNKALNFLRRSKRQVELTENVFVEGLEETILEKERASAVMKAISLLDEETASIFWLVYVEDYSYQDVGMILGITAKKVDNLLSYAKRKLRRQLEGLK